MGSLLLVLFTLTFCGHSTWARNIQSSEHGDRNAVFVEEEEASKFLGRHLMFNRFDFEMFTQGNLERECIEEVCNYEEAREVFESIPDTDAFWKEYTSEMGLQSAFEDRERLRCSDAQWEFIPPSGSQDREESGPLVFHVSSGMVVRDELYLKHEGLESFKPDAGNDRKPMKGAQQWSDVGELRKVEDEMGCIFNLPTNDEYARPNNGASKLDVTALLVGLIAGGVAIVIMGLLIWYSCQKRPIRTRSRRSNASVIIRRLEEVSLQPLPTPPLSDELDEYGLPSYEQATARNGPHDAPPPPYPGSRPGTIRR
ncbi:hypothetical protein NFI96_026027 [Prochilodus magdalenae]|nr:hypothetical protein NFI96_026027 [Prochilodus magdalenae]